MEWSKKFCVEFIMMQKKQLLFKINVLKILLFQVASQNASSLKKSWFKTFQKNFFFQKNEINRTQQSISSQKDSAALSWNSAKHG